MGGSIIGMNNKNGRVAGAGALIPSPPQSLLIPPAPSSCVVTNRSTFLYLLSNPIQTNIFRQKM